MHRIVAAIFLAWGSAALPAAGAAFTIQVVDAQTGRGVPLVELKTVDGTAYYTDSAGIVAFDDPAMMDQKVFFYVASHGYEFAPDGFGFHGRALDVRQGQEARITIERRNVAERLYRVTGAGIYRDSVLLGRAAPIRQPLLNAQVTGSDSVQSKLYRGRLYWFWGDTNRPRYPLGNFQVPGATSRLPSDGGLDPAQGVDLEYFVDDEGFAKRTCEMPGDGPTWIHGLVAVKNKAGEEELYAAYMKVRGMLDVYQHGLVRFDDARREFVKVCEFDFHAPFHPHGQTLVHTAGETAYVYFGNPIPNVRVRADAAQLARLEEYEAFTCLTPGSRLRQAGSGAIDVRAATVERDAEGRCRWGWKKDAPPISPDEQARLVTAGKLRTPEGLHVLRDIETAKPVKPHSGNVAWNAHRQAWTMIFVESGGTSPFGEVWYAEADAPAGPWVYARKVVTHDNYTFYNPAQHPELAQEGGRLLYFEGTYSTFFTNKAQPTPRYDYNQIMYRLDLADPRLALPVAFAATSAGAKQRLERFAPQRGSVAIRFFAMPRAGEGRVPVYAVDSPQGQKLTLQQPATDTDRPREPLFYALPADQENPPPGTVPLYEFSAGAHGTAYFTQADAGPGYTRDAQQPPLCRVWRNPLATMTIDWE